MRYECELFGNSSGSHGRVARRSQCREFGILWSKYSESTAARRMCWPRWRQMESGRFNCQETLRREGLRAGRESRDGNKNRHWVWSCDLHGVCRTKTKRRQECFNIAVSLNTCSAMEPETMGNWLVMKLVLCFVLHTPFLARRLCEQVT